MNSGATSRPALRRLSDITINRIAAGEVVDRPASVVKELVENAIDAGATEVVIKIEAAGNNLISISDNGHGMSKEDMLLAVEKHTTSKLQENNLFDIRYFGFRGEALPSIASISRMTIKSRGIDQDHGWSLTINGGIKEKSEPIACNVGTTIEVRDLFFATPARLKFLRSSTTEVKHLQDIVKKIAFAHPNVGFQFFIDDKLSLSLDATNSESTLLSRVEGILGKEFRDNAVSVNVTNEDWSIEAYISLPTYNVGTSNEQYLYINKRPVRDKVVLAAIKAAYHDFVSHDRHPVVVLFMNVPGQAVDVNVHPTKNEVRFRDPNAIRGFIVSSLKNALSKDGHRASSTIAQVALEFMRPSSGASQSSSVPVSHQAAWGSQSSRSTYQPSNRSHVEQSLISSGPIAKNFAEHSHNQDLHNHPLGAARCQVHGCYIIAQTADDFIIVDQHAAHERLLYEQLKADYANNAIESQRLLIPEILESDEDTIAKLLAMKEEFNRNGIVVENCTKKSLMITAIPSLLIECNITKLIQHMLDEIIDTEHSNSLATTINEKLATHACHYSIRSGRILNIDEMNMLLREMEKVHHSGQCNHGRPTYIKLQLKDIETLFGRS